MDKARFVFEIRLLKMEEPTREQWETMYEIHCRNLHESVEQTYRRVMFPRDGIIDRRRIPQGYNGSVTPLSVLAEWGRKNYEKFGGKSVRN